MRESLDIFLTQVPGQPAWHAVPGSLLDGGLGLSAKATMYLLHLLTRPAGHHLSLQGLGECFTDKRTALTAALTELEEGGYLRRTRTRSGGGTFGRWHWQVSNNPHAWPEMLETPLSENQQVVAPESVENLKVVSPKSVGNTTFGKPASGWKPASGKPESGEARTALPEAIITVQLADKQNSIADLNQRLLSGQYEIAPEIAPGAGLLSNTLLLERTVRTVKKEVLVEGKESAERKPRASSDRPFTADQQLIWDQGWARGYALANDGDQPSSPTRQTRIDFKTACAKLLEATAQFAQSSGRPHAELAAALLYSIFERRHLLDEWQRNNCLSQPAHFAKQFDPIRTKLRAAGQPRQAPRPQLSPEQYAAQAAEKTRRSDLARGFTIPAGQEHFKGDLPPRKPDDDFCPPDLDE